MNNKSEKVVAALIENEAYKICKETIEKKNKKIDNYCKELKYDIEYKIENAKNDYIFQIYIEYNPKFVPKIKLNEIINEYRIKGFKVKNKCNFYWIKKCKKLIISWKYLK